MELNIPAIKGIGDSMLYFVDRYDGNAVHRRQQRHHLRHRLRPHRPAPPALKAPVLP